MQGNQNRTSVINRIRCNDVSWAVPVLIFVLMAGTAFAESDIVEFEIDAQGTKSALLELAEESGVQIIFTPDIVTDLSSGEVRGRMTIDEAVERILEKTNLSHERITERTIVIKRPEVPEADGVTGARSNGVDFLRTGVLLAQHQASAAQSQDRSTSRTTDSAKANEEQEEVLEHIVVTGSRIRGVQSASPIVTIDRAEIERAGFATVEDVVENLPQNFGGGASLDATNSTNQGQVVGGRVNAFAGGTSVNLRGLGANSTLVLLNGRRMSASGFSALFTNISSIPVTVIERVEVMTDGASAIYGSDAIGGVVNFILRENYEGAETRLRYGSDARGDAPNIQFGQSLGSAWGSGNVLLTYEYYDSEALAAADREFTASNDLSVFGGTDWRQPGGNPGNIRTGPPGARVFYAIPEGQNGTALTPADFVGLENTQNFHNAQSNIDTTPSVEQHSGFLHLTQTIGSVELFGAARFSSRKSARRAPQGVIDFTVTGDDPATPDVVEGNPFFVDPTGTGLTTVTVDNYALFDDFGPQLGLGEIESSGATLGAQFAFGETWQWELVGNWSKEESPQWLGNQIDRSALPAAVNQTDPNLAFNPFGDGSNTNPAVLAALVEPRVFASSSKNELWSVSFNVDGELFDTPGGAAKVVAGIDFRDESLITEDTQGGTVDAVTTDRSRDILAAYGELFLPLVGRTNSRTWLQRLEISLAARYEKYSDFGDTINPKLGILWSPSESLAFRGTVGTSFRAPGLVDLDDSDVRWFYFPSVFGLPHSIILQGGKNSDLQAEEATTWTAGFQWREGGLSLDATYFNVDFTGRIEAPAFSIITATSDPRFASIRIDNPTSDEIAAVVNDPRYDPDAWLLFGLGSFTAADLISGAIPLGAIVDNRLTNLAESIVTGAELQLSYQFDTDLGSFGVGLNGSYMFDFERRLLPVDPLVEEVDTLGRPVDFRARSSVTWSNDRWSISGFVNYTDGYTDNVSDPERAVDSWTTVDLSVAYNTGNNAGFLRDTSLSLTTQNLFDEDPPFVNTEGGVGYDATNANPLGQAFAFQITKNW